MMYRVKLNKYIIKMDQISIYPKKKKKLKHEEEHKYYERVNTLKKYIDDNNEIVKKVTHLKNDIHKLINLNNPIFEYKNIYICAFNRIISENNNLLLTNDEQQKKLQKIEELYKDIYQMTLMTEHNYKTIITANNLTKKTLIECKNNIINENIIFNNNFKLVMNKITGNTNEILLSQILKFIKDKNIIISVNTSYETICDKLCESYKNREYVSTKLITIELQKIYDDYCNKNSLDKCRLILTLTKFDSYIGFICESFNEITKKISYCQDKDYTKCFMFINEHIKVLEKNKLSWINNIYFNLINILFMTTDLSIIKNKIYLKYCNQYIRHTFLNYFKIIEFTKNKTKEQFSVHLEEYIKVQNKYAHWVTPRTFELSENLQFPNDDNLRLITSKESNLVGKYFNIKVTNDFKTKSIFENILKNQKTSEEQIKAIVEKYKEKLKALISDKEIDDEKKITIEKTLKTKKEKELNNIGKVLRCIKHKINLTETQKEIIFNWFKICDKVYDNALEKFNNGELNIYNYKGEKLKVFEDVFKGDDKGCPYDVLTYEMQRFCSNAKSCITQIKEGNISHFKMKKRMHFKSQSISITSPNIKQNGFYVTLLGSIEGFNFDEINNDCILTYDMKTKDFYFSIPTYVIKNTGKKKKQRRNSKNVPKREPSKDYTIEDLMYTFSKKKRKRKRKKKKKVNNNETNQEEINQEEINNNLPKEKEEIIILDPGEKIFQGYYTLKNGGHFGTSIRYFILKYQSKIIKLQKKLSKSKENKKKWKRIKSNINNMYQKIHNIVTELHNKLALHLCKNYKKIVIPIFGTQDMVRKDGKTRKSVIEENIKKIREENKNPNDQKRKINEYRKKRKLNGKVKFSLMNQRHYNFRQHLIAKAEEYGCEVKVVTEEFSSQTCGICLSLSKTYEKRKKICSHCKTEINRDIGASRNICIMNEAKINKN